MLMSLCLNLTSGGDFQGPCSNKFSYLLVGVLRRCRRYSTKLEKRWYQDLRWSRLWTSGQRGSLSGDSHVLAVQCPCFSFNMVGVFMSFHRSWFMNTIYTVINNTRKYNLGMYICMFKHKLVYLA